MNLKIHWSKPEEVKMSHSLALFILFFSRIETFASSALKTPCSRHSRGKNWHIKATNLFILSSSTNVLTTRRASRSRWPERSAWWSLQSGHKRRRRRDRRGSAALHRKKRSEDVLNMRRMQNWLIFYLRKSFYWNERMFAYTFKCTQLRITSNTYTVNSLKHIIMHSGIKEFLVFDVWM